MSGTWDEFADTWEEQPDVRDYASKAFESLITVFSLAKSHTVLDFGSGTGLLAEKIAPNVRSVVAVDASPKMIEVLNKKKISNVSGLSLLLTDTAVTENSLLQQEFDLIVASSVLSFVDDYEGTLSLLGSLLAPGGVLVHWDWMAEDTGGMGFTKDRVRAAFAQSELSLTTVAVPFEMGGHGQIAQRVIMAAAREVRAPLPGTLLSSRFGTCIKKATAEDVADILRLEVASFPADEAANEEQIADRRARASDFFWIARDPDSPATVTGFVNGTCIEGDHIDHDCMSNHVPGGKVLVIHSVTVAEAFRRRGFATAMLKDYVQMLLGNRSVDTVLLLCKAYLIGFYKNCGFSIVGLSEVIHGADRWFEMKLDLVEARYPEQLHVDAFSFRPFTGNPAAVVFEHRDEQWMQNTAFENNFAETAFLSAVAGSDHEYRIRWFTPTVEIDLCGHATMAAAHALFSTGRVPRGKTITLRTLRAGTLFADAGVNGSIRLNFPSTPPTAQDFLQEEKLALCAGLGITESEMLFKGRSIYDVFIEVSPSTFSSMLLRPIIISELKKVLCRGVIVTSAAKGVPGVEDRISVQGSKSSLVPHFCSRFFAPLVDVDEDSFTGSAHCSLAPYWFAKMASLALVTPEGNLLTAYQASKRGGLAQLSLTADAASGSERVILTGWGITTARCKLMV